MYHIFFLLSFHFISTTKTLYLRTKNLCIFIFLGQPLFVRCAPYIRISRCISVLGVECATNVHIYFKICCMASWFGSWYLVWCFLPYHNTHPLNEVILFVDTCILSMQRHTNAKLFGFKHLWCTLLISFGEIIWMKNKKKYENNRKYRITKEWRMFSALKYIHFAQSSNHFPASS